jgi:aryl-alcohol dehydrogenase-like predicted oxidoreductase
VLHQPGITSVIVGARKPEQITQIAQASSLVLSVELLQALDEATEPVKFALGANADMWQSSSCFR